jgi:hypothetical protein
MTHFFIPKPSVTVAMQWTGDNFAELEAWAEVHASWALPISVVSGNRIAMHPDSGSQPIPVNGWITNVGAASDSYVAQLQEVAGADVTYDTTPVEP